MPTPKRSWRVIPGPGLEYAVEQLARREGRSLGNMCVKLISEAVDARKLAAKSQSPEVRALVAMLTTPANAAPADESSPS
jgi:hypothetical protein